MQGVQLAPDGILLGGVRRELGRQECGELVIGDTRGVGAVGEIAGEGCRQLPFCGCGVAGEGREEAAVAGVAGDLGRRPRLTWRRAGTMPCAMPSRSVAM